MRKRVSHQAPTLKSIKTILSPSGAGIKTQQSLSTRKCRPTQESTMLQQTRQSGVTLEEQRSPAHQSKTLLAGSDHPVGSSFLPTLKLAEEAIQRRKELRAKLQNNSMTRQEWKEVGGDKVLTNTVLDCIYQKYIDYQQVSKRHASHERSYDDLKV